MEQKEIWKTVKDVCIAIAAIVLPVIIILGVFQIGYSRGKYDGEYAFAYAIDYGNNICSNWSTETGTICNYPDCTNICWNREFVWGILNKTKLD